MKLLNLIVLFSWGCFIQVHADKTENNLRSLLLEVLKKDLREELKQLETPTKPHLNIAVLGHVDHGKTTLVNAISELEVLKCGEEADLGPSRGIDVSVNRMTCETSDRSGRSYTFFDGSSHADIVKLLISGPGMDAAILVVSAPDGPMPQTREHILLARQSGIGYLVVFMNKIDQVDDEELLELVELEIRELLSAYEFPGDDVPIIMGSALNALEGDDEAKMSIKNLLDTIEEYFPEPERLIDQPFLMPVEDIFSITGRGTVATGRIERGVVRVGDEVEIVGIRETRKTTVSGVEMFRKLLDEGVAGDNVGVLLRGVDKEDIERGMVLAKPGSITPHTHFKAEVYILTKDEGGRHTPFFNGYRPQFYFRTTDVTGVVTLPEGTEMVMPGDNVSLEVQLIIPVALEGGMRFAIREGGRTVGAGRVSDIIE